MRLPKQFSQKARKTFYFIHLWTGLILGAWLVLMGLSGSYLAYRSELTGWEARRRVAAVVPARDAKIIPVSRAIAALKAVDPTLTPERGIYLPPKEYGYYLYNARGEFNGERTSMIYLVDPVTARVYPPVPRNTLWVETFEHLHANLIQGARGSITNGLFSFFTVFMLLSGLWLWWPSNWKQLKQRLWVKRGQSLKRTLFDLHNVLGIYLFGLMLLLAVTGVALVLNSQTENSLTRLVDRAYGVKEQPRGRRGGDEKRPARGKRNGSETVSGGMMPDVEVRGKELPLDTLVEKAKAAMPGHTLLFISQPRRAGQPFQTSFDPISFNNGLVLFDPYTGHKLEADGLTFSPGGLTMKVVGDLHYGWFGGNWSKFFYCLSGFLPLGLFITGTWMWINKKRGQAKNKTKRENAAPKVGAEVVA